MNSESISLYNLPISQQSLLQSIQQHRSFLLQASAAPMLKLSFFNSSQDNFPVPQLPLTPRRKRIDPSLMQNSNLLKTSLCPTQNYEKAPTGSNKTFETGLLIPRLKLQHVSLQATLGENYNSSLGMPSMKLAFSSQEILKKISEQNRKQGFLKVLQSSLEPQLKKIQKIGKFNLKQNQLTSEASLMNTKLQAKINEKASQKAELFAFHEKLLLVTANSPNRESTKSQTDSIKTEKKVETASKKSSDPKREFVTKIVDIKKYLQGLEELLGNGIVEAKAIKLLAKQEYDVDECLKLVKMKKTYFMTHFKTE